jgi:DNA-binding NtrC family response regulator
MNARQAAENAVHRLKTDDLAEIFSTEVSRRARFSGASRTNSKAASVTGEARRYAMASARILVADDDQPLLELYTQWLADLGYQTVQATTGNAALGRAASNRLDGALIDLCLPDMSGLEVVEALSLAGVPSIVVTGNGSCATAVAAMRRGALDFVEKPIDVDEFSRVIRQRTDTCPTSSSRKNRGNAD